MTHLDEIIERMAQAIDSERSGEAAEGATEYDRDLARAALAAALDGLGEMTAGVDRTQRDIAHCGDDYGFGWNACVELVRARFAEIKEMLG